MQIRHQLRLVNWKNFVNRLQLYSNLVVDDEVYAITTIEVDALVFDRETYFGAKAQLSKRQFSTKTCQIC